jgi:hypothetical protein
MRPDIHAECMRLKDKLDPHQTGSQYAVSASRLVRAYFLVVDFFADSEKGIGLSAHVVCTC